MAKHNKIEYRDFYDVPRMFLVSHDGAQFLFECRFDDDLDDYADAYKIFLMPPREKLDLEGSWEHLSESATKFLGELPVNAVTFDETRRNAIDSQVIEELMKKKAA
jgi:hypothetical protein